jgi:hypothetical protein
VYTPFWWKILREGNHFKDVGVGWRITLIESSINRMEGRGLNCSGSEYGQWEGSCVCSNKPGSRKCGEFPGQLRNYSFCRRTLFRGDC